jgi:hypothetical protein
MKIGAREIAIGLALVAAVWWSNRAPASQWQTIPGYTPGGGKIT